MKTLLSDSFETGFYDQDGKPELTVPIGWRCAWVEDPKEGILDRPECDYEFKDRGDWRIRTGKYGARVATAFATHKAALRRQVTVPYVSGVLCLKAWIQHCSVHNDGKKGAIAQRVGIDPFGGLDFLSDRIRWSDWIGQDSHPEWGGETWKLLEVCTEAVGTSSKATLFLMSECRWPVRTNAAFWDDITFTFDPSEGQTEKWGVLVDAVEAIADALHDLAVELRS